ncbi:hypothetical protein [Streptomyces sp. NPDC020965]|uniref:hypothetical protein n=1 Tax=Streptomyces sp. NPDC020965 TaxID=3365105 RepID=UPI00378B948E
MARPVLPYEYRAARTLPLLFGAGLGAVVCAVPFVFSLEVDLGAAVLLAHLAAVLGGLGLGFVLDDPAATTTALCPSPWWLRRSLRIAGALLVLAAAWSLGVVLVGRALQPGPELPYGDLAAESAALALLTVALALAGLRFTQGRGGGLVSASALVVVVLTLVFLPSDVALFSDPEDTARWEGAADRWRVLALFALAGALALLPVPPSPRR